MKLVDILGGKKHIGQSSFSTEAMEASVLQPPLISPAAKSLVVPDPILVPSEPMDATPPVAVAQPNTAPTDSVPKENQKEKELVPLATARPLIKFPIIRAVQKNYHFHHCHWFTKKFLLYRRVIN